MPFKLFRSTEFARSSTFSPQEQRGATHPALVLVLLSLWMATAGNLALWRALLGLPEMAQARGWWFMACFALIIASLNCAAMSLVAWRWTLKPVALFFLLATALGAHFMLAYGVVIDTTMMVNVLQTDPRETRDLLSGRLALTLAVLAVAPAWWLWRTPVRRLSWRGWLLGNGLLFLASMAVFVAVLLLVFQDFSSLMRNQVQLRYLINPLNSVYALGEIAARPLARDESVTLPIGEDARPGPAFAQGGKPPLLVLVLGETGRSGNFGINGYTRPTTPLLAAENVASFRNAWSCGTSTAASVPCMFSHLGRAGFDARSHNFENLLDVLQHAGLAVLWVDNQSGCKGVCDRVPHATTARQDVPGLCQAQECFDAVLLDGLDERIAALPAERRARGVVVVLHQMGSHGPAYFKRTPVAYKKFTPECASNSLQECSRDEVVNAYDNTILYTDFFLASVVKWLKAREDRAQTAMLYVADHGESLGENNLYLHGLPYAVAPDVQKHVPWISWLSPGMEQQRGVSTGCLKQRLDEPLSHDHYFHSVLGLLDVRTALYQRVLDFYRPCTAR